MNQLQEPITIEEFHRRSNAGELHPEAEAALDTTTLLLIQFIVEDMKAAEQQQQEAE